MRSLVVDWPQDHSRCMCVRYGIWMWVCVSEGALNSPNAICTRTHISTLKNFLSADSERMSQPIVSKNNHLAIFPRFFEDKEPLGNFCELTTRNFNADIFSNAGTSYTVLQNEILWMVTKRIHLSIFHAPSYSKHREKPWDSTWPNAGDIGEFWHQKIGYWLIKNI